jgi:hypothetical protein
MLLKGSKVRRSDQGKGAVEPDLVIEGCPVWMELQDAAGSDYHPLVKLEQAERDVFQTESDLWPVSICHQTGKHTIEVCTRLRTLLLLGDFDLPGETSCWYANIPVILDFEKFKELLRHEHERR